MEPDGLVSLDAKNPALVAAAARLHGELLPGSPISALGPGFMEGVYYSRLVADGLIRCDLFRHEGRYVGFVAYTEFPFTFMGTGLRRHFLALAAVLAASILRRPARLLTIARVLLQTGQRGARRAEEPVGEVLSIGVLEGHRHATAGPMGLRASHVLFRKALSYFHARGVPRMQVSAESGNERAVRFYSSYTDVVLDNTVDAGEQRFFVVDTAPYDGSDLP